MSISGNLGIYAAAFAFHLLAILACAEDKRVLLISIDGVRADALEIADAPNLRGLYENGAGFYSRGFVEDATITGPSWSTIWHGVHRDVHRVNTSRDYGDADFISAPNFLHRLKRFNPQWRTAAFYTWGAFGDNFVDPALVDSPPLIEYNHRHRPHTPEQIALIKQSGIDYFAFWPYRRGGDERITEAAVKVLTTGNPQVVMFYLADPDAAGHDHGFGPNIEPYMDQIRISDKLVGRVLNSLRNRPGVLNRSEQWLIMVVSDHGGGIDGRHEFNRFGEREVPFIIHGPGVVTDAPSVKPKAVDVVPTLLAYMNVPAKAAGLLHGRPIGLSPCPDPQLGYGINLIFNGDAEFDHGFHSQEFDQAISGWNDQNMTGDKDGWHSMTVMR